jgi:hypothetical protein
MNLSEPVEKIVKICDSVFSTIVKEYGSPYLLQNLIKQVCLKVQEIISKNYPNIFKSLDNHVDTIGSYRTSHTEHTACSCYVSFRYGAIITGNRTRKTQKCWYNAQNSLKSARI